MRNARFAGGIAAGVLVTAMWMQDFDAQTPATGAAPAARGQGTRGDGAGTQGGARGGGGRRGRGAAPAGPSKPTPRWPDGRVNLSQAPGVKGFWNVMTGSLIAPGGLPDNLTLDQVPFQDWSRALYEYRQRRGGLDDPHARCQPAGGMRFFTVPNGMEFIDQPELNRIFIIGGENRDWRRIAMEPGRKHPPEDELVPSYFGDSIGRWEGDTLVVDTVGYNEKFWFIRGGLPHTRFMHLTERFTRINFDTLRYQVTIDDKGAYTRPWSGGWDISWQYTNYDGSPGGEIHEYFCIDNERDAVEFAGK
ncbi:MAG TPA: hypothetical protein VFD21_00315 [Vicinamibacterales bacterium]|jgi:hypothetical protein|nr:hypothetical protein [Vicinamibacterales bacterium]